MEYIKATDINIDCVFNIVQNTVKTIYPKYYPGEVVDFFCELHNRENIARDIGNGNVGILMVGNQIVGTMAMVKWRSVKGLFHCNGDIIFN